MMYSNISLNFRETVSLSRHLNRHLHITEKHVPIYQATKCVHVNFNDFKNSQSSRYAWVFFLSQQAALKI